MRTLFMSFLILVISCLKFAWLAMFYYFLLLIEIPTDLEPSVSTEGSSDSEEDEEEDPCVVCLCKFNEGQEITRLDCDHVFHRVCLNRWFASGHWICPICRERTSLWLSDQIGLAEVLLMRFSTTLSDNQRDRRWLNQ
ncbi:hypothetical protein Tsubulata_018160 [Turnera subulata]|uniref:RING-type domain-containing protein n=1 Tax=Turnera subulata TaxID=218843 RepID=A0A9Q0G2W4_9ROSI|nr:hypothetical protein Tsubulata_018160 [Turnera subulata]